MPLSAQFALLIVLPIVTIGIGLIVMESINRRWLNDLIQKRLPSARRVRKLDEHRLLELRSMLADRIARDTAQFPRDQRKIFFHALWSAMLLEAGADDTVDRKEIELVEKLFGEIVSNVPDRKLMLREAGRILRSRKTALSRISKVAGASMQSKFNILQGAFLVSVANKVLEPTEANYLEKISDALGLTPRERALAFDELSDMLDLTVARRDFLFWESPSTSKKR